MKNKLFVDSEVGTPCEDSFLFLIIFRLAKQESREETLWRIKTTIIVVPLPQLSGAIPMGKSAKSLSVNNCVVLQSSSICLTRE